MVSNLVMLQLCAGCLAPLLFSSFFFVLVTPLFFMPICNLYRPATGNGIALDAVPALNSTLLRRKGSHLRGQCRRERASTSLLASRGCFELGPTPYICRPFHRSLWFLTKTQKNEIFSFNQWFSQ